MGSNRARSKRFGLLPPEPPTGRSGNDTGNGFAVMVSSSQHFDELPPLNSITDLGSMVQAALRQRTRADRNDAAHARDRRIRSTGTGLLCACVERALTKTSSSAIAPKQ